jgi:hypothetical protein
LYSIEHREQNGRVLIDSEPEFLAPHPEFFKWADIDAILISNYTCMLSLPLHIIVKTKSDCCTVHREQNGRVLIDSEPEFLAPHPEFFNWADIDAILISNYTCMLALPYITEKTGFRQEVI